MKKSDSLKGLRISRAAVAKIIWWAVEAGADALTLQAICDYIAGPRGVVPSGIDRDIYAEAVAETKRAAKRSRKAREVAARRRIARDVSAVPTTSPAPDEAPVSHDLQSEAADHDRPDKKVCISRNVTPAAPPTPEHMRYLDRISGHAGPRSRMKVRKLKRQAV